MHGSILGIHALGTAALSYGVVDKSTLTSICLSLIGSETVPIRDVTRCCLHDFELVDSEILSILTNDITRFCREDISCRRETHASSIDGMLATVGDRIENSPGSFLTDTSVFHADQPQVLVAVDLCMGHPSSTVRQRASQICVILCSPSRVDYKTGLSCSHIYETVSYVVQSSTDWKRTEAYMLVCSEVLAAHESAIFDTEDSLSAPMVLVPLLVSIVSALPGLLNHEVYEVRRVAVQIIPGLARAVVLSGSEEAYAACAVPVEMFPEDHMVCICVWISEVAKASQLIYETLQSENTADRFGIQSWVSNLPCHLSEEVNYF